MKGVIFHVAHMNTHIQIRNVPNAIHRKLKIRAAEQDLTITDYVKQLIGAELEKPTLAEMAERLSKLPPVETTPTIAELIRQDRDER